MQLVKAKRDMLLRPLQIVSGIVERRHTLPILANILIRKTGQQISFLSTDIEIQITTYAQVGYGNETAATTVGARKLLDILRVLPDTHEVSIILSNQRLTIQSGKSHFSLQTLSAQEFPKVTQAEKYNTQVMLRQKTLKNLFNMVYFAMAQQDIRYYLNGLLLVVENKNIIAVATDGHRLALGQVLIEQQVPRQEVIIPRKTIIELQRLLEENDEMIKLELTNNQVKSTFSNIELISKLIEGKFPDFTRVIPKNYKNNFCIKRDLLLHSLHRTAIMAHNKFKSVKWIIAPSNLKISSMNTDKEEAIEELEINYSGDQISIGFNITYLLDVLNNLKSDYINIALNDANSSALITIPHNTNFKYIVMPMRI